MTHSPEITVTVKDPKTGRAFDFRREATGSLVMLHPDTGKDLARVVIGADGTPELTVLDPQVRTPEDAGKCLLECARDCNGDVLCVAGCAAMCATIII